MKRRMIGAWMALMITASSLVASPSPAADMSSVSADLQQEQTEPEEEEEAPDIPVTDQPGEAEMPVPTALHEPETVEEAFEEGERLGRDKGELLKLIELVVRRLRKGDTAEQTAELLEEPPEVIRKIYEAAGEFAPEYDVQSIYRKYIGD